MQQKVTEININEFGRFDNLKQTVDVTLAKAYFERISGEPIKAFRVPMMIDQLLRRFIFEGGFDTEL